MWTLTSKKSGEVYYFYPGKEKHTVGRTKTDLIIKEDATISRVHACLYPSDNHVKVVDLGSRYGTFYNHNIDNVVPMEKNVNVEIRNGERVQFGRLGNEWVLSQLNIRTMISTLTKEQRSDVKKYIDLLNGKIIDSWADICTHLTMAEITVTLKVLHALVANIPIVSIEFWKSYVQNLQEGKQPPNPQDYIPKVGESFLDKDKIHFGYNETRKSVFAGKTFVFMCKKNFDKYNPVITQAGGECKDLNTGVQKTFLTRKNVIVVQYISSGQSQNSQAYDAISDYMKKKNRRIVPEFEIGLAIIFCSTDKYCNPDYNVISDIIPCTSVFLTTSNVLSKNTQDPFLRLSETASMEIPETASFHIPETASIHIPETAAVDIPDTAPVEIPETAPPEILETASVEMPEIATNKINEIDEVNDNDSMESIAYDEVPNTEPAPKTEEVIECKSPTNDENSLMKRKRTLDDNDDTIKKKMHLSDTNPKLAPIAKTTQPPEKGGWHDLSSVSAIKKRQRDIIIYASDEEDESMYISETQSKRLKSAEESFKSNETPKLAPVNHGIDKDMFNFNEQEISEGVSYEKTQPFPLHSTQNRTQTNKRSEPSLTNTRPFQRIIPTTKQPEPTRQVQRQPIKITSEGWLNASLNKMKIKTEDEVKLEDGTIDKSVAEWIDSIKGAFEVRVKKMDLTSRSERDSSINDESSNAGNSTVKNFKAFSKKRNYQLQKIIINTKSECVGSRHI